MLINFRSAVNQTGNEDKYTAMGYFYRYFKTERTILI